MKKECRIVLPFYKTAFAAAFVVILSLVRGVSMSLEIGIALEPAMAVLAAAFCADTYVLEIVSGRSEVWRLYPVRNRMCVVGRRLVIQELYLLLLAAAGYGCFFLFQGREIFSFMNPKPVGELQRFLVYLGAIMVTLVFWGILSHTIASLCRNLWCGIGGSLILWILTFSERGDRCLGPWNVFSYTFRNVEDSSDMSWLLGKGVCIICSVAMCAALPVILKKRG